MSDACGSESQNDGIQALYTELATHPEKDFGWGKGKENARLLGYDTEWLDRLPEAIWESDAAVGNPFHLGPIRPGETVIDLGCGAGADACVAALLVGDSGNVIGVDITPAMVAKARDNATLACLANIKIHEADIAELKIPDECADVVISNGAINLSARKACVLKEAFRVLRPGGRLQIADMVRDKPGDSTETISSDDWADCIAGTLAPERFVSMIEEAGFMNIRPLETTGYRTSRSTLGALFYAERPVDRGA